MTERHDVDTQTGIRSVISRVRNDPALAGRYVRSAAKHRLLGPALSHWRPGAVAVFHIGRCGSTVLTNQLDQHPRISWDGESLVRVFEDLRASGTNRGESGFDPAAYIGSRLTRSGRSWFGFDLKFFHLTEFGDSLEKYLDGLEAAGITHVVSLKRSNYFRKVVSSQNAVRRGEYHIRQERTDPLPPLHIDPHDIFIDVRQGSLRDHFARWDSWYEQLENWGRGRQLLTLTYEHDIETDPQIAYRKVIEFLGEEALPVEIDLSRTNPEPLDQLIENLDEIRDYLADTPWALPDQE